MISPLLHIFVTCPGIPIHFSVSLDNFALQITKSLLLKLQYAPEYGSLEALINLRIVRLSLFHLIFPSIGSARITP